MPLVGQVRDGRLWVRCWNCGDSVYNPHHAHMSINPEGLYHCVRCGTGGKLGPKEYLEYISGASYGQLDLEQWKPNDYQKLYVQLIPGPANSRFSRLERFHLKTNRGNRDAFIIQNGLGDDIGILVNDGKQKVVYGHRGIAWPSEDPPTSSPSKPLRLVEGPYDVLFSRDVCGFGLPDSHCLSMLRGQFIILCPDGDVWHDSDKLAVVQKALQSQQVYVIGIEFIPGGKDPDEVMPEDRVYIPRADLNWEKKSPTFKELLGREIE